MYYENDFYDEPSEFEMQVEEFKDALKSAVKKEHQDEVNRLRAENDELQEIRNNFESIKQQYDKKLRELEIEKQKATRDAKRMRLNELFGDMNVVMYRPISTHVYEPKCNVCDNHRQITFMSPSGNEMRDNCKCGKIHTKYVSRPYYCTEFRVNTRTTTGELPLLMWYEQYKDSTSDHDGYEYSGSDRVRVIYSEGTDFADILTDHKYNIYFRDVEDCDKFCKWANDKNGITDNMTPDRQSHKLRKTVCNT